MNQRRVLKVACRHKSAATGYNYAGPFPRNALFLRLSVKVAFQVQSHMVLFLDVAGSIGGERWRRTLEANCINTDLISDRCRQL